MVSVVAALEALREWAENLVALKVAVMVAVAREVARVAAMEAGAKEAEKEVAETAVGREVSEARVAT